MPRPSRQSVINKEWRLQHVSKTGEHSRAQRFDHKATNFQQVPTKVARHQPISVLRRRGFDSRRLQGEVCTPDACARRLRDLNRGVSVSAECAAGTCRRLG